jgi:formate hydrogenlyase subunit 4
MDALVLMLAQLIVGIALAPLLFGITRKTKARLQYRRGASVLQPYRDLAKWWAKDPVESDAASPLTAAVPVVVLATMLLAVLLVPLVARTPALPGPADILVVIGLLALVRFTLALGALDAGGAFGGMGASREVAIASLVEPGLMLALAVGVTAAGTTDLATIAASGELLGGAGVTPGLALGAAAFAIIAVAETGHEPVDNPDTHLELTMIHEGMILEASGRRLGALMLASWLKLVVVVGLFSAVFLPVGMASEVTPLALAAGMAAAAVKLVIAAIILALLDASLAKLRILQLPSLLGVAATLAVTALAAQLWLTA